MIGIPTDQLIQNLELLRQSLCAYGPTVRRCDCKYRLIGGPVSTQVTGKGEVTGCPELRLAMERLRNADRILQLANGVQRESERRANQCARCGARVGRSLCVGCS